MISDEEAPIKEPLKVKIEHEKVKKYDNEPTNIILMYPKTFIFLSFILLLVIVLSIVLPTTLVTKKKVIMVSPKCPDGINTPKIDCLEKLSENNNKDMCLAKGCCWIPDTDSFTPDCVFPYNLGYRNNRWKENSYSRYWLDLIKIDSASSYSQMKISNIEAKIELQTDTRLHIKIYPKRNFRNKNQRWEIPTGISNENVYKPLYRVQMSENPFTIQIFRNDSNQIIFDTSKSSLIFADQFLQVTTSLSSPNLFGIGEHTKDTLLHDLNYKTWSMFASHNHPYNYMDKSNLYSQFPMYLNIEPDGNSHVVVFYNSNPSEIFLTPYPSLTYRTTGGIFDIYIFMGPTPIEAIAQFQQAFGLPRLPPYWSLGLQIGADGYSNLENMKDFVNSFKNSSLPFDSVYIGTEYMMNSSMFTLSHQFKHISEYVDELRFENRTAIVKFTPGILNNSFNYPFTDGTQNTKIWILENFFSAPYVGKLLGRDVIYPDFTMDRTRDWWKDALNRFIVKDENVKLDGIFLDYIEPLNENFPITCQNNKWNLPFYKPKAIPDFLYNHTLCMDARHENSKHFNVHGAYSHFMIAATFKALDALSNNRSFIMSRNAFIGSGKMSAKYLGEYKSDWNNFKRFVVSLIEMPMFGFNMVGGDTCGSVDVTDYDYQLCSNWIKLSGLAPMMRLYFNNYTDNLHKKFFTREYFEVLNSTLYLRYSLMPFFYTQMYHAAMSGLMPIRSLAFQFPNDTVTYKISNQFLWGDKLMVTAGVEPGFSQRVYLPAGTWYDYFRGEKKTTLGEFTEMQTGVNTSALHIRGGSIITIQETYKTAIGSRHTFVDIIIALDSNFTANGDFFVDDSTRRTSLKRENYHRLTEFKAYRSDDYGIIEIKRVDGRFRTDLAYRNLIIYGLLAQPKRITVNEDSNAIDPYRTSWDNFLNVYKVNLQTEQKKKVLVDNEYLSLKWASGFVYVPVIQV